MNPQFEQRGAFDFRVLIPLGVVLLCIFAVAYFFYGLQPNTEDMSLSAPHEFRISKGEGFRSIGARLSQESLIKSIMVFKLYSLVTGKAQKFQPGVYQIAPTMSVPQIIDLLSAKGRSDVLVTIPEGSTLRDIDGILASAGIVQEKTISNFPLKNLKADYLFLSQVSSLEGFLFPDSYYFELNSSPEEVIRKMLDNFSKKAWPILSENKNWYERLILASFLEREVPEFDDRKIVAGILLKRIEAKMPLQVDATISYAKCEGDIRNCENVRVLRSDLSFPSPYNTYERLGWTPTPISNPGEAALRAAISPQQSSYWYYLSASSTKETYFSKTLQEHNKNRAKYL